MHSRGLAWVVLLLILGCGKVIYSSTEFIIVWGASWPLSSGMALLTEFLVWPPEVCKIVAQNLYKERKRLLVYTLGIQVVMQGRPVLLDVARAAWIPLCLISKLSFRKACDPKSHGQNQPT